MSRPKLGILLEFGFHEIKKYIHNGFAEKLKQQVDIIWFAIDKGNQTFDDYFKQTGCPMVYYSPDTFKMGLTKTEQRNHRIRLAWMKKRNMGVFHNYKNLSNRQWLDNWMGWNWIKKGYEQKTLTEVEQVYEHQELAIDFKRYGITDVLSTGYSSAFAKCFMVTAYHKGIKTHYLVNSWKDLYTNNFIPFRFLNTLFVWNEEMKTKYLDHMPYLRNTTICCSGNPTFDAILQHQPKFTKAYYAHKYNLQLNAHWFLYTLMPPGLVNDELETVKLLCETLLKRYSENEIEVIIRRNPNHTAADFVHEKLPSNAHLAEHFCSYDASADMIVQSAEGETEWLDLLHYAYANFSVPSTVTLEFSLLNKAVINIRFNPQGEQDHRVTQHFEAGFYRNLFDHKTVWRVNHQHELLPVLKEVLENSSSNPQSAKNVYASDLIIHHLLN